MAVGTKSADNVNELGKSRRPTPNEPTTIVQGHCLNDLCSPVGRRGLSGIVVEG